MHGVRVADYLLQLNGSPAIIVFTCGARMWTFVLNRMCVKGDRYPFRAGKPSQLKGRQRSKRGVAHLRERVRKHAFLTAHAGDSCI